MAKGLAALEREVVACRRCPRLIAWCERVAREKVRRHEDETYWGRPLPSFGDRRARLLIVGLAPAAHGANRTGRMFTGDRSGQWLYRSLHRAGFANRPESIGPGDGLTLAGAYVSAVVRCAPPANRPTRAEEDACRPFLVEELRRLSGLRVTLALGSIAHRGVLAALAELGVPIPRPRPKFAHGAEWTFDGGAKTLLASYHPSQQNTFTGRLTEPMLDAVFTRARKLVEGP